jgi:diaminopimelate epimerase
MEIPFFKYHGTGNDFVLVDNRVQILQGNEHEFFAAICHRRFGIGADGVILLNAHETYDFEMDYFNSDGQRSSMCGNGGRCIVQLAHDLGIVAEQAHFLAVDGEHTAQVADGRVKLKMSMPHGYEQLSAQDYWIHTGSPHFVRFIDGDLAALDVVGIGRAIRNSAPWAQEGTNVNFVQELGEGLVAVRTYERGVEDETWSCGTGVTAVAEVLKRRQPAAPYNIRLKTPGGMLTVHLGDDMAPWLEGPAKFVFQGVIAQHDHA